MVLLLVAIRDLCEYSKFSWGYMLRLIYTSNKNPICTIMFMISHIIMWTDTCNHYIMLGL